MKDDLSELDDCVAVFVGYKGNENSCFVPVELITDTSTLSDWINDGGRLYVCAEWKNGTDCLGSTNRNNLNTFLGAIGSSMSIPSTDFDGNRTPVAGSVALLSGGKTFITDNTGLVSGGTSLATMAGSQIAGIEAKGDGFILVVADVNIRDSSSNCEWVKVFVQGENDEIM